MRRALIGMIALTALAAGPPPAVAQTVADKADGRCILVLALASASAKDAGQKERAMQGSFYYLGRLNAHAMSAKLNSLLVGEAKGLSNAQQVQAELTRCGAELNARNSEMRAGLMEVQRVGQAAAAATPAAKPAAK